MNKTNTTIEINWLLLSSSIFRSTLLLKLTLVSCLLAGCVAVPKIQQENMVNVDALKTPRISNSESVNLSVNKWWEKIGDKQLNELIEEVLKNNSDMKIAVLNLEKSEKNIVLAKSANIPSVNLDGYSQRQKLSEEGLIPPPFNGSFINMSQVAFSSSYEFDLFGKYDNLIKQQDFLNKGLQLKRNSLTLMLSNQATKLYGYWQYLQLTKQNIENQIALEQQIIAMKKAKYNLGDTVKQDLLAEQNVLNNLFVERENNKQTILQTENKLQQLLGTYTPLKLRKNKQIFKSLNLNVNSVQSDVVINRPDVAYYLTLIDAQKAQLNSLKADFYPSISLTGQLGLQRTSLNPFDLKDWFGSFGPSIHLPILDPGLIKSNYEIAGIDVNIFVAQYNGAVIKSFYDVDTQLYDYKQAKNILEQQRKTYSNQLADYQLNETQWKLNNISKLEYSAFKRQQLGNDLQFTINNYTYFNSQIDLINALGGVVDISQR